MGEGGGVTMRPGGGHAKGAQFERDICKRMSLWWTGGERDDVFWRTPQSGGRATRRGQKGQKTFGHHGDIQAIDPIGRPLLDHMIFELKCGYGHTSVMDLIDGSGKSTWDKWISGARRVSIESGSRTWALIVRRSNKKIVICVLVDSHLTFLPVTAPMPKHIQVFDVGGNDEWLMVMEFEDFLSWADPGELR
jgi:hypothetical protein